MIYDSFKEKDIFIDFKLKERADEILALLREINKDLDFDLFDKEISQLTLEKIKELELKVKDHQDNLMKIKELKNQNNV